MLKTSEGRAKLLARLRNKAVGEQANMLANASGWIDPLVMKLQGIPDQRLRYFSDLLRAAMPWIDASFTDVPLNAQRFKCLLGVGKVEEWEPFLEELKSSLPTYAGITAVQFQLCATGIPGRAVCYCEISGFPLRVLRGLENWRISYRQVSKDWPLHTHIDPTLFVHPMVSSSKELKECAADFRLFLLAVILRILGRNPRVRIPPGQYSFDFGHGDRRDFGNERAFRMNGLPPEHRGHIEDAVKKVLDSCNVIHLMALSVLANFIGRATYAPKMAKDDTGKDYPVPGFSHAVALKLSNELSQSARQRGLGIDKIKQIENRLIDWDDVINSLSPWTEAIVNSAEDAYNWEVAAPNDLMPDRAKRRVKKQFFEDGWIDQFIGEQHGNPDPGSGNIHPPPILGCNVPPPITTGGIPILLTYFLHINGQQYGPYPIQQLRDWINGGQVLPSTMAWRDGMLQWQALNTLPEFAVSPPVLGAPPLPIV